MIKIISYDYKHQDYKTWNASLVVQKNDFLITKNIFPFFIEYSDGRKKEFQIKTFISHFYSEWFNIITNYDNNGNFLHWYINIVTPINHSKEVISYDDLLLDLRVYQDYSWDMLDEDEYKEVLHQIPESTQKKISYAVERVKELASKKSAIFIKDLLSQYP